MTASLVIVITFSIYVRMAHKMHIFLINLFKLNYPLHVSNKYMFIIRRLFLYTQHIVFYHESMGCPAANTM